MGRRDLYKTVLRWWQLIVQRPPALSAGFCSFQSWTKPLRSNGARTRFAGCANIIMNNAPIATSGAIVTARILNGNAIRDQIYAELKQEIAALAAAGIRPGLAAVLVGENAASQIYVRSKIAACEQLGLGSWLHTPPATVSTADMLAL